MTESKSICVACRNVQVTNRNDPWYRWLCIKAPRAARFNPVTGDTVADPPWYYCKDENFGDCKLFEPGPNQITPAQMPE